MLSQNRFRAKRQLTAIYLTIAFVYPKNFDSEQMHRRPACCSERQWYKFNVEIGCITLIEREQIDVNS